MPQRRFLIASSLARLVRKERDITARIVEGYFPARQDRDHFVSIEPGHAYLVLAALRDGAGQEERTEVPRRQAEALFAVCAGKVGFERTVLNLPGGQDAMLDHFIAPGQLDLVSVELQGRETMEAFAPPAWFGPEVTRNEAYERAALARGGIPAAADIALSNAGLEDLLDTLEGRLGTVQFGRMPFPRPNATVVSDPFPGSPSEADEASAAPGDEGMSAMMAGLAEALESGQATRPPPETIEAPLRQAEPHDRAEPGEGGVAREGHAAEQPLAPASSPARPPETRPFFPPRPNNRVG